jgi:isopenicillin-N epimerase
MAPGVEASRRGGNESAAHWLLDPDVAMLNHGSFGACPRVVLDAQERYRRRMEREPVQFFMRHREPLLDAARETLGRFLGADPAGLAFVRNATQGVNSVLGSLPLEPGDELLLTDHAYNACRNVVQATASRTGAKLVVASIPLPVESSQAIVDAILQRVSQRTRLAMIDHVTSPTAILFPIDAIVQKLQASGVDTLVDGAHAPGMVPVDLDGLGAAYYTGNCHKWLCAPKGAGFLHVRCDRRQEVGPAVISHGYNVRRPGRSRFHEEFDWTGTDDPTPWLCVPEAIRFVETLVPGGVEGLMRRNHELVVHGRRTLCEALGSEPLCPDAMLGSMASVRLPDSREPTTGWLHPQQARLHDRFRIEVPIFPWPKLPNLLLRISAQAYNRVEEFGQLAEAVIASARD